MKAVDLTGKIVFSCRLLGPWQALVSSSVTRTRAHSSESGDEAVGRCVLTPLCSGMGLRALTGRQRQPCVFVFSSKVTCTQVCSHRVTRVPLLPVAPVYVTLTMCPNHDSAATGRPESVSLVYPGLSLALPVIFLHKTVL